MSTPSAAFCAIDFGTSNSAIAIPAPGDAGQTGMRLVPLEGAHLTMPTAVFYATDTDDLPPAARPGPSLDDALPRCFGRAAVQAYIDGELDARGEPKPARAGPARAGPAGSSL